MQSLFVDEAMGIADFDARCAFFEKKVKTSSVEHVRDLHLGLIPGAEVEFRKHVTAAWARASQYVHPSKQQLAERLRLEQNGIRPGFETAEQLKRVVDAVDTTTAIVVALAFHAIGQSFTGDLLVGGLDAIDAWSFHRDRFVALIDAQFDYKAERQAILDHVRRRRGARLTGAD